jgi:STE24 endopeptidase
MFQFCQDLVGLPWTVYSVFVLEQKHGFNNQTVGFFIKDQIKGMLVKYILLSIIISGILFFIGWGGNYFFIYTWLFICIVVFVMMTIYPSFIAPLFDTYTPLPGGQLKTGIEDLAQGLNYPLRKIFVVDGSTRSSHSNAYMYGFYKNKRIVLFDTLLEVGLVPEVDKLRKNRKAQKLPQPVEDAEGDEGKPFEASEVDKDEETKEDDKPSQPNEKKGCNQEEVLAVLAHELGHWKYSHVVKNLIVMQLHILLSLYVFSFFFKQQDIYTSFGFQDSQPMIIGLIIVFQLLFTPFHTVVGFLMIQMTRRFEYQADAFAQELGRGSFLQSALTKLYKDNLGFPIADPLYSAFNHSHPTFLERTRALDLAAKKEN